MNRFLFSFLATLTLVMLTACTAVPVASGAHIHVENAWARPTIGSPMGGTSATPDMQTMSGMTDNEATSAVYLVIINNGDQADTLVGASTDVAKGIEMHETRINNNIAEMIPLTRLDIPAGGRIEFKPEGYHVMLTGLTRELKVGETVKLTLQFQKSGAIALDVPIRMDQ